MKSLQKDTCRVALVQAEPVMFEKRAGMEKALSLIRAAEGVTIRVYGDEQIPENNGVWRVEGGRTVPADGEADLETSARAMGRMLSGAASLYEAQLRGDARVLSKRDTLEAVFVRKGIYVGDFF